MQLFFDSMTGNVRRFSHKLQNLCGVPIFDLSMHKPHGPFLLVTYTFGRGEVPASTTHFLEHHASDLCGVVASGSFHWGQNFARAGDHIAERYHVPLIAKINKSGSEANTQAVANWLQQGLHE